MVARLVITDGTTHVNLLGRTGFLLKEWKPARPKPIYALRSSTLADEKQLIDYRWDSVEEELTLDIRHHNQDLMIAEANDLDRLLIQAMNYQRTPWAHGPVYFEAKADRETNTRYALIKGYTPYNDTNPFGQPFAADACKAGMSELELKIVRSAWLGLPPGQGECAISSAIQAYETAGVAALYYTAQSADDCEADQTGAVIDLNNTTNRFGNTGAPNVNDTGVRFNNLAIPTGATILSCYISLKAGAARAGATCNVQIRGNDIDTSVAFTTFAAFNALNKTSAIAYWAAVPAWLLDTWYETPDLSAILQEIVDRPGWATGNDVSFLIEDDDTTPSTNGAYREAWAWDCGVDADRPILHVSYSTVETDRGQVATCDEILVANKCTKAQVTHAYAYDSSLATFGANIIGAAKPVNLFPAAIEDADALYIGVAAGGADAGPFDNVVFTISTASVLTNTPTWVGQVWTGAAWGTVDIQYCQYVFTATGVHHLVFYPPATWVPNVVNGVSAYWFRIVIDIDGGDVMTTPQQGTRDPYSAVWNWVETEDVSGVLPALAKIEARNTDEMISSPVLIGLTRLFVGLRSTDRGEDFRPWLNAAESQNPDGVSFAIAGADTAISRVYYSPSGWGLVWTPAGLTAMGKRGYWAFTHDIAAQYQGRYVAFVRGGDGDTGRAYVRLGLYIGTNTDPLWVSETVRLAPNAPTALNVAACCLGPIELWGQHIGRLQTPGDTLRLYVEMSCTNACTVTINDIALVPYDEWAADASVGLTNYFGSASLECGDGPLALDSIGLPVEPYRAYVEDYSDHTQVVGNAQMVTNGPCILQANRTQRVYFFGFSWSAADVALITWGNNLEGVYLQKVERWMSLRGNE